jgi:hypothetical protein
MNNFSITRRPEKRFVLPDGARFVDANAKS